MNTRKKYGKEFKLDAIRLVKEQGYTARQASLPRQADQITAGQAVVC